MVHSLVRLSGFITGILMAMASFSAHALRDDVLVIVNDNSTDSPQVGAYYAQQRGIDPANIVHVNVPSSYFISWDDFRRLRDQLIRFMQDHTLDDPALAPAVLPAVLALAWAPAVMATAEAEASKAKSPLVKSL